MQEKDEENEVNHISNQTKLQRPGHIYETVTWVAMEHLYFSIYSTDN